MKRIVCLMLALLLVTAMVIPAAAATQEGDIVNLEKSRSIVIAVEWDKQQPTLVFIAPDGTEYSPLEERAGTSAAFSEGSLYYIIENAAAGQWRVRYDKKDNTSLDISVHNYQSPLLIRSFTMTAPADSRSTVSFLVDGPVGQRYSYRISAMVDHIGTEKELATGTASVGVATDRAVSFSKLASYDGYMLKLTVWYQADGVDVMDFAFTEPFAYQNTNQDKDLPEFSVAVIPEEYLLQVRWPDLPWSVESVMVAVFEDGAQEPLFYEEYQREDEYMEFGYTPDAANVSVEVSFRRSGVYSTPVRRDFRPDDFLLEPVDGDAVNTLQYVLPYRGMTGQTLTAVVNGAASQKTLQGEGSLQFTLQDDWNRLEASYTDDSGITWLLRKDILVDRRPPALYVSRDYDGMRLEENTLTVSGTVADCAVLTLNGQTVTPDENGAFSETLSLVSGANTLTLVAADALGNESLYTATVYSGSGSGGQYQNGADPEGPGRVLAMLTAEGSYYVTAIVSVLCLLVIGYALIFWKKGGKQ